MNGHSQVGNSRQMNSVLEILYFGMKTRKTWVPFSCYFIVVFDSLVLIYGLTGSPRLGFLFSSLYWSIFTMLY